MNKKYLPLWIIWFALLQGSVIIVFLLSNGFPSLNFSLAKSTDLLSFIVFIPIIISLIARIGAFIALLSYIPLYLNKHPKTKVFINRVNL